MNPIDTIDRLSILPHDEQSRLVATRSTEDRNKAIESCLRYAKKLAGKSTSAGREDEMNDILSETTLGMIEAAIRFNPANGTTFLTYATWWIRREIYKYYENRNLVYVPKKKFTGGLRPLMVYTDATVNDNDNSPWGNTLKDDKENPEEKLMRESEWSQLREAVDSLPSRMNTVIVGRFWRGKTLREIGLEMGTSRERVRQIQAEAESLLVKKMGRPLAKRPS